MRQLVVVITADFSAVEGELHAFEEGREEAIFSFPVNVGKRGMAWGRGVHSYWLLSGGHKQEGDDKAPAGLFSLSALFGKGSFPESKMPYLEVSSSHRCVDDVASQFYNIIVDETVVVKDWKSAEEMARPDGLYNLGVVIDHNADPVTPTMGSCIFMHLWRGPGIGTAGCTAMSEENLRTLCAWLDPQKEPHLLQVPKEGYSSFLSSLRVEPIKTAVTKRLGKLIKA